MELNKRTLHEKTAAPLAGDPADVSRDLPEEEDISVIDNGFTRITRAFFNAAYATKDTQPGSRHDDDYKNAEKRRADMLFELAVQQMIDSASSAIYQHINELDALLTDLNKRLDELEANQQELSREREEALNQIKDLKEGKTQTLEKYEEIKEEEVTAKTDVASAKSEQELCEEEENLLACARQHAPETVDESGNLKPGEDRNKVYALVQMRTAEMVQEAEAKLKDVQQKRVEIEDYLETLNQELKQAVEKLEGIENKIEKNAEEIQTLTSQIEKLKNDREEAQELAQKIDDPEFQRRLKAGEVTQSEFQAMLPDSMKDKTQPGVTTPQTALLPLLAPETLPPLYLTELSASAAGGNRLTHSASSTLNDGGGIKGDSIQNSFAKAVSGETPAETIVPTPEGPLVEQKNQMAAGGMGFN